MIEKRKKIAGLAILTTLVLSGCSTANAPLVFATYSKVGVDVSVAQGSPAEAVFGYKRFEGAVVPVNPESAKGAPEDVKSVFAGICIDNGWLTGIKLGQVFATGDAAVNAVYSPTLQNVFATDCKAR